MLIFLELLLAHVLIDGIYFFSLLNNRMRYYLYIIEWNKNAFLTLAGLLIRS